MADAYRNELVTRSAPRWAWDAIDNALEDFKRGATPNKRSIAAISDALSAMVIAGERADDQPISPKEAKRHGNQG